MLIIPAIDIKDGCVVRYVQGKLDKKVYSRDPVKTARHWQKQGAKFLHVVDLDGAMSGIAKNIDAVIQIAKDLEIPVEFGGGVRNAAMIRKLLKAGISRLVLGTKAAEDPVFLKKMFKEFGKKIIVSIDTKEGNVLTRGWKGSGKKIPGLELACLLKEIGFRELIFTDILKDGTLSGPNVKAVKAFLKKTELKIIASGGISSLNDLFRLKEMEKDGLTGVIIGKALYEGKFTLPEALKIS